jgi:chorismate mutase
MLVSPLLSLEKKTGWEKIALLDCQQMFVKDDLSKCIRLLAYVYLPNEQVPQNPYLGKAKNLRPDR